MRAIIHVWKTDTGIVILLGITADHNTRESLPFSRAVGDRGILIADRPNLVGFPRIEVISRKAGFFVNRSYEAINQS